jgi:hypothetical protein
MRTLTLAASALVLTSTLALAQASSPLSLTYGQVQALSAGLSTLDNGSVEQCPAKPAEPPTPAKPGTPPPAPAACPYVKSTALLVAMAKDMVALEGPQKAFTTAQDALRKEVLNDPKLKGDQAKQVAAFAPRIQELLDQKVDLSLYTFTLADLNLAQNKLTATALAQLAPLVPELQAQAKAATKK